MIDSWMMIISVRWDIFNWCIDICRPILEEVFRLCSCMEFWGLIHSLRVVASWLVSSFRCLREREYGSDKQIQGTILTDLKVRGNMFPEVYLRLSHKRISSTELCNGAFWRFKHKRYLSIFCNMVCNRDHC
jgi:hypothetical protein